MFKMNATCIITQGICDGSCQFAVGLLNMYIHVCVLTRRDWMLTGFRDACKHI